jgi:hypothetical protein
MMNEGRVILNEYGGVIGNPSSSEFKSILDRHKRILGLIDDIIKVEGK